MLYIIHIFSILATYSTHRILLDLNILMVHMMRRDSSLGIATGYGLEDQGVAVRVPVGPRIFSPSRRPDRLWDPPSLLANIGGFFPGDKADGA
jgi:hypothetical protein